MGAGIAREDQGKGVRWLRRLGVCALVFLTVLLLAAPVQAADPPDPDTLQVNSARVVRDLVEEGDLLLVLHYTIDWDNPANQPEEPANSTFMIRLMDATGTTPLGIAAPYPFFDSGYGEGCASLYFNTEEAPEWGGAYIIRVEASPSYWEDPPLATLTLTSTEYSAFEGQEENEEWLKAYLIDVGIDLEFAWDAPGELITQSVGTVLAEAGEMYFEGAIPSLRTLCPSIFMTQVAVPDAEPREWNQSKAEEYQDRWDGTFVEDANEGIEDLFGSSSMFWNLVGFGVMLGCMSVSFAKYQTARPGMLLGFIPIPILARLGLFSAAFMAVIVFGFIVYLGYNFFWRSAS